MPRSTHASLTVDHEVYETLRTRAADLSLNTYLRRLLNLTPAPTPHRPRRAVPFVFPDAKTLAATARSIASDLTRLASSLDHGYHQHGGLAKFARPLAALKRAVRRLP